MVPVDASGSDAARSPSPILTKPGLWRRFKNYFVHEDKNLRGIFQNAAGDIDTKQVLLILYGIVVVGQIRRILYYVIVQ